LKKKSESFIWNTNLKEVEYKRIVIYEVVFPFQLCCFYIRALVVISLRKSCTCLRLKKNRKQISFISDLEEESGKERNNERNIEVQSVSNLM